MAWDGSDRRDRLPTNWASEIVPAVKKRAGGRCEARLPRSKSRCPRDGTEVDHRQRGDDHSMKNLQLLCKHHHGLKSSAEGRQAKAERKTRGGRRVEIHPGLRR